MYFTHFFPLITITDLTGGQRGRPQWGRPRQIHFTRHTNAINAIVKSITCPYYKSTQVHIPCPFAFMTTQLDTFIILRPVACMCAFLHYVQKIIKIMCPARKVFFYHVSTMYIVVWYAMLSNYHLPNFDAHDRTKQRIQSAHDIPRIRKNNAEFSRNPFVSSQLPQKFLSL